MAYEIPGFLYTLPSGVDFRVGQGQFRFVDISTLGKAILPTAGGSVIGVRQTRSNLNEALTIMADGISFIEAGGAIVAGAQVTTDATGRVVTATTGNRIHGRAFEAASGAGIQIAVFLRSVPAVV